MGAARSGQHAFFLLAYGNEAAHDCSEYWRVFMWRAIARCEEK